MIALAPDSPIVLTDLAATEALARRLAPMLRAGDVLALEGTLGAGKTAFSRALIRQLLGDQSADVPSPTFTLVQTYEAPEGLLIWHVDLYRIDNQRDLAELGLDDAFDEALTIIEWPDRLGAALPRDHLTIHLDVIDQDARRIVLRGTDNWMERLRHG